MTNCEIESFNLQKTHEKTLQILKKKKRKKISISSR